MTKLDPYIERLHHAITTDAHRPKRNRRTLLVLFRQIRAKGSTGSSSRLTVNVRRWLAHTGKRPARVGNDCRIGSSETTGLQRCHRPPKYPENTAGVAPTPALGASRAQRNRNEKQGSTMAVTLGALG